MKEIKATIQPPMLFRVLQALNELPDFPGFTVFKCEGQGRGRSIGVKKGRNEDTVRYKLKERIEIICADDMVDSIVDVIMRNARTGTPGSGIITTCDVSCVVRIRTGEMAEHAI